MMHGLVRSVRYMSSKTIRYGEGFARPKGSQESVKPETRRRQVATSLPSHLANPDKPVIDTTKLSVKQQHREQLRQLRHAYARELLQVQGQKDAAARSRQEAHDKRIQAMHDKYAAEKQLALQHEKEVLNMLGNQDALLSDHDYHEQHKTERLQNRQRHEQQQSLARLRQLTQMYHATDAFVTLDNLDAKLDALLAHKDSPPMYTLDELMVTPSAEVDEIKTRKQLLNEAMGL
ncbi:hypothetical protein DM01DRAFT_1333700 [Hesseltinella vesiculosa]|uniref:Uncharacterized protein n=1 Tax=Hesseltinella vesiculosa TaxID=101127 RepID=A0A1X2GND6_9FUNG|nr:hypothetical protein DM01DRAFT_1333700 [Hesseltinella vesiculosa]